MAERSRSQKNHEAIEPSTLSNEFARMVRRFKKFSRYIQRLFEETEKSFEEINEKKIFTTGLFSFSNR